MSDAAAIRKTILTILGGIAPEADLSQLAPDANFRRALDLDSMDFQNFVIRLCKDLDVHIPDRDAGQLTTLDACVRWLKKPGLEAVEKDRESA